MKKYIWISLGFIIFLAGIVYMANTGSLFLGRLYRIPNFDKIGHFVLAGTLAFVVNRALACKKTEILGNGVLVGSLCVMCVALLEESSQIFIDTRTFSISDLMYDLVGIYVGGFVAVATARPLSIFDLSNFRPTANLK